jgi:hypothetical protein
VQDGCEASGLDEISLHGLSSLFGEDPSLGVKIRWFSAAGQRAEIYQG